MKVQMTTQKAPPQKPTDLEGVRYQIRVNEQVLKERVIRASLRPKPRWMPERVYQYLKRTLFVVTEDAT